MGGKGLGGRSRYGAAAAHCAADQAVRSLREGRITVLWRFIVLYAAMDAAFGVASPFLRRP
jgi:hypothetical protein